MRMQRYFSSTLVALASAVLATLFLVACQQSQPPTPPPSTAEKVFVIFEGPWAIVPDPKDANSVLALAPKTKSHRPLAVTPASTVLEAGVYDLAVPAHGAPAALNPDPSFFRTKVDPQSVQRALDTKLGRYAIRLPKPEAYLAGARHRSRVGSTYPPDVSTEQNYVTTVSLRYSVASLTGFSLAGTKDVGGAFNPLLLQLDTPVVRFVIDPTEYVSTDSCYTHSREAFRDLVRLLGVTLYVDFPESPADCHKKDPQIRAKAQVLHGLPLERIAGVFSQDFSSPQTAGIAGGVVATLLDSAVRKLAPSLTAVILFFHTDGVMCMSPIIFGI
jgi:hypothetical protein